jgi:uncharacterized protein (TIGR02421 family)
MPQEMSSLIALLRERMEQGKRIATELPGGGRVHVERMLPFVVLYRCPAAPDPGTEELVTSEASFLLGEDSPASTRALREVVRELRSPSLERFGAFISLEIWTRPTEHPPIGEKPARAPGFRLYGSPSGPTVERFLDLLERELGRIQARDQSARVERVAANRDFPGRVRPLLKTAEARESQVMQIGVELEPYYQTPDRSEVYPTLLKGLRRSFGRALRHAIYFFANQETDYRPRSYHSLGRRSFSKSVRTVDARLAEIAASFDFLPYVNPMNVTALWEEFRRKDFEVIPKFRYRPMPVDPSLLKRALYAIPFESVEDPTLLDLFIQKRRELDTKLTMLTDRGSERFLLGSLQLYRRIAPALVRMSERILESVPPETSRPHGGFLKPEEFADLVRQEVAYYREICPEMNPDVRVSKDLAGGVMVSKGNLLVATHARIPVERADALVQHEVGTHMVTYFNGMNQKLSLLKFGLAGYAALQEGMAVLSEHLVGGLSPSRLRVLAGRVIACQTVVDGADFLETFRLLCRYGFHRKTAFDVTMRVHRGGGLTKDSIYLRGLKEILEFLREGGEFERLFMGKLATRHLPVIEELESRQIVTPPRLLPRYLSRPECRARLEGLRTGVEIHKLLDLDSLPQ